MWLVSSSLLLRPSLNTRTATDIKISRKSNYATLKIWMGDQKKKPWDGSEQLFVAPLLLHHHLLLETPKL